MIRVEKDAQRTDAYQKNDNLVLSESARADSIPGLEIEANDVRCTHGATAGRVDEEMIFYCPGPRHPPRDRRPADRRGLLRQRLRPDHPGTGPGDPPPGRGRQAGNNGQDVAGMTTRLSRDCTTRITKGVRTMGEPYAHPEVLVSADWVEEHLNDPKVRIVESDEDLLLYDLGHVPGAVRIDWQGDLQDQIVRDYIDAEKFAELCCSQRHRQRHDRGLLRRQVELVGLLRLLGLHAVRSQELQDHERRPQALDRPGPARLHRGALATRRRSTWSPATTRRGSGPSATTCWPTSRPANR